MKSQINVTINDSRKAIDIDVENKLGNTIRANVNNHQMLYVNENRIGITGGNEIVPPMNSMDADLLALYLLSKGGN